VTGLADDAVRSRDLYEITAETTLPTFPKDGSVKTLGIGVVRWIHAHLLQPDGDDAGEPFRLTPEQVNFLLWWYAVDDNGRFIYRRGVLRRSKGWGKSPFTGAICLAELCGPVRFAHWDDTGRPVGKAHSMPWVVVAGVSETQTENTFAAIRAMCEDSDLVETVGLDVGMTRILTPSGGKIVPITASSSSQEGARPSFAVMDEPHHWTKSNGGHKLARVIRRNLAKSRDGSARAIETTNAHEPGEESIAEFSYLTFLAIKEGRTKGKGLLYDSRTAPSLSTEQMADEKLLRATLAAVYGDATWIDLDRLVEEIYDQDTTPEDARRFYLNEIVAAADSWVSPDEWDANKRPEIDPLTNDQPITLGFDGGLTDDSTALVAVRVSDGAPFLLAIWEKPEGPAGAGWQVPKDQARDAVDWAFGHLDVVAFFSDVAYWETDVDRWRDMYGERLLLKATTRHAVAWDMRGHLADTTRETESLHRAITDGECPWGPHRINDGRDGAEILRRHVLNARRRPNRWGLSFGKESRESPKKVDALAALLLARMARTRVLGEGALTKRRKTAGTLIGF
jgi:hypothetical protein